MSGDCQQLECLKRIHDFVVAGVGNELTEGHWVEFERLLSENNDACRLYFEYVEETCFLQTVLQMTPNKEFPSTDTDLSLQARNSTAGIVSFAPLHSTLAFSNPLFFSHLLLAYLVATVVVGAGLLVGSFTYVSPPGEIAARTPRNTGDASTIAASPRSTIVGRITGMANCTVANLQNDGVVRLNDLYALRSGMMEITYDTGARVTLQGPAKYEIASKNGGALMVGKLTGEADAESAKGFTIRTPTAIVTDVGTEFGVEVDGAGATTSHVFRGAVRVQPIDGSGNVSRSGRLLRANQSASVAPVATPTLGAPAVVMLARPIGSRFSLRLKERDPNCLADLRSDYDRHHPHNGDSGEESVTDRFGSGRWSFLCSRTEACKRADVDLRPLRYSFHADEKLRAGCYASKGQFLDLPRRQERAIDCGHVGQGIRGRRTGRRRDCVASRPRRIRAAISRGSVDGGSGRSGHNRRLWRFA